MYTQVCNPPPPPLRIAVQQPGYTLTPGSHGKHRHAWQLMLRRKLDYLATTSGLGRREAYGLGCWVLGGLGVWGLGA